VKDERFISQFIEIVVAGKWRDNAGVSNGKLTSLVMENGRG